MDWIDYREKLGIGFADHDKVEYFMVKIFNLLDDVAGEFAFVTSTITEGKYEEAAAKFDNIITRIRIE